jgi:hypothetical protein
VPPTNEGMGFKTLKGSYIQKESFLDSKDSRKRRLTTSLSKTLVYLGKVFGIIKPCISKADDFVSFSFPFYCRSNMD